jgi:hypothetical protein
MERHAHPLGYTHNSLDTIGLYQAYDNAFGNHVDRVPKWGSLFVLVGLSADKLNSKRQFSHTSIYALDIWTWVSRRSAVKEFSRVTECCDVILHRNDGRSLLLCICVVMRSRSLF